MGRFAKIEKVSPTERGVPFPLGEYRLEIVKNKYQDSKDGNKNYFITETIVKSSTNPEVAEGEKRSHVIWLNNPKAYDAPWSDMKAYVCACLGLKGEQHELITEEVLEYVVTNNDDMPGGPFQGLEIGLTVTSRKKKEDDGDFSPHTYHDPDEAMQQELLQHFIEIGLIEAA